MVFYTLHHWTHRFSSNHTIKSVYCKEIPEIKTTNSSFSLPERVRFKGPFNENKYTYKSHV